MSKFGAALLLLCLSTIGALGAPLTFDFYATGAFSGSVPPGSGVLARVTIDQYLNANTVSVTTEVTSNAYPTFYVGILGLNSLLDPSGFTWGVVSGPTPDGVELQLDAFKMDGTGGFVDIKIDFDNSAANRVKFGSPSTLFFSRSGGLAPQNFLSTAVDSGYGAVIHAQAIDAQGNSVWLSSTPVPEPGSLAMAGIGGGLLLAGLCVQKLRARE